MRYLDYEGDSTVNITRWFCLPPVGMIFLACGYDLITLYISLELMALTFSARGFHETRETLKRLRAMKYFLLGAFCLACALWNVSALRIAGSPNLGEMRAALPR